jgi:4-hydroxy-2-oxoheptanedioate aldolase
MVDGEDYIREANRERLVIVQIEDPEPMSELDEIAAMEGIDVIFFGPGDFSQGAGVPFQMGHPDVQNALRRVAEAARKHGKFAGTVAGYANMQERIDMGYQLLSVNADVCILTEGFKHVAEAFSRHAKGPVERDIP